MKRKGSESTDMLIRRLDELLTSEESDMIKEVLETEEIALGMIDRMRERLIWSRPVLNAILEKFRSKKIQKAIKTLSHDLSQKGIKTDETIIEKYISKVVYINPVKSNPIKKAFSSIPCGFKRVRVAFLFLSKSLYLYVCYSPLMGIKRAFLIDKPTFEKIKGESELEFISIPPEYAFVSLKLSYKNTSAQEVAAMDFDAKLILESLALAATLNVDSIFYRYLGPKDFDDIENFDETEVILTMGEILVDHELIKEYALKYGDIVNPKISLSKEIISYNVDQLLEEVTNKVLTEELREEILLAIKDEILFSKFLGKEVKKELFVLMFLFNQKYKNLLKKPLEIFLKAIYNREQKQRSMEF